MIVVSHNALISPCMELVADVPNHFLLESGIRPTFGHLPGMPVHDLIPLRLGVRACGIIQAAKELADQIRPVLYG